MERSEHGWTYIQFNYGGWTECECGYRPESQEDMDAHDAANIQEWSFDFDWTKPPLSLNYRMHHMQAAKLTKEIRRLIHSLARDIPDLQRCEVTLTWFVNTRTRRDDENPVPTLKALCDGLVDAEIVPDDTNEFMVKNMPVIVYRKGQPASMRLTVRDIGEEG